MYLGIDFGTSGCRATVINEHHERIAASRCPLPAPDRSQGRIEQLAPLWTDALSGLLKQLAQDVDLGLIRRLVIDGTSGTVLLCDAKGTAVTPALMYNDGSSVEALGIIKQHCPDEAHLCLSVTSGLAKALQLISPADHSQSLRITSQADYIAGWLSGHSGTSDYHNALKLGYDCNHQQWPAWIKNLLPEGSLPRVFEPGQPITMVDSTQASRFGFSPDLQICAGSTDANAAFLATGLHHPGDAVTSLGSTLVLKILNEKPLQDLESGIYSHRMGDYWLVGGASNAGANILSHYFTNQQLNELSKQITLTEKTNLNYYPLISPGERFPVNDAGKQPLLTPRPASDVEFLKGLLEGLSAIEQQGYARLVSMGAHPPEQIMTSGGGSVNDTWRAMRQQYLGLRVLRSPQTEASFGSALLALSGLKAYKKSTENT